MVKKQDMGGKEKIASALIQKTKKNDYFALEKNKKGGWDRRALFTNPDLVKIAKSQSHKKGWGYGYGPISGS